MSSPDQGDSDKLQLDKADYTEASDQKLACSKCSTEIYNNYYDISGSIVCERCRYEVEAAYNAGSSFGRLVKATAYGTLAAAVGAGIYYAVLALTGYEFGLIAIVVGLLVGGAVKKGSEGRGGWKYQLLAIFLTYSAIVVTYIPLIVKSYRSETAKQSTVTSSTAQDPKPSEVVSNEQAQKDASLTVEKPTVGMLFFGVIVLFIVAFISPFLAGFQNIIGLLIIGIALYEAWKITKKVPMVITGPFAISSSRGEPPVEDSSAGA